MENKRKVSILIPYKTEGKEVFVYLQKRSKDAKRLPGYFGFFGGGAEGDENPEETLKREISEEMNFTPEGFSYLSRYEFYKGILDVFMLKVKDGFDDSIKILEGEYGKWFDRKSIMAETRFINEDKIILEDFYDFIANN